jgi:ferredoxin
LEGCTTSRLEGPSDWKECTVRATVTDDCTACGLCVETCSDVFQLGDDDEKARVIADPVPADVADKAREAAEGCPVEAIELSGE